MHSSIRGSSMAGGLTFGLSVRQALARGTDGHFHADGFLDVVCHAEQLGFDHVFAADHIFIPQYWAKRIGDYFLEPLSLLSFLAAGTTTIELVVSCLVVPYRQPIATAKTIAT